MASFNTSELSFADYPGFLPAWDSIPERNWWISIASAGLIVVLLIGSLAACVRSSSREYSARRARHSRSISGPPQNFQRYAEKRFGDHSVTSSHSSKGSDTGTRITYDTNPFGKAPVLLVNAIEHPQTSAWPQMERLSYMHQPINYSALQRPPPSRGNSIRSQRRVPVPLMIPEESPEESSEDQEDRRSALTAGSGWDVEQGPKETKFGFAM